MSDDVQTLSDTDQRCLSTIRYSLDKRTDYSWTQEDALSAILALNEMYWEDVVSNLTDEELEQLSNGDDLIGVKSRARRQNEKPTIKTDLDGPNSTVVDELPPSHALLPNQTNIFEIAKSWIARLRNNI